MRLLSPIIVLLLIFGPLPLVPPPTAPTSLIFPANQGGFISLQWTDNSSDEVTFRIERKTGAGGTYAEIGTTAANDNTFRDSASDAVTVPVLPSTTYFYRVRARNASGDSAYLTEQSLTTDSVTTTEAWPVNPVVNLGESITMTCSSFGADGRAYYFTNSVTTWNITSGIATVDTDLDAAAFTPPGTNRIVEIQPVSAGTTTATCTIDGVTSAARTLTVRDPAASPVATITGGNKTAKVYEPLFFDGGTSTGVKNLMWDFGDGASGDPGRDQDDKNIETTHAYRAAGVYTATLQVWNTGGTPSTVASITCTISAHPRNTPITFTSIADLQTKLASAVNGDVFRAAAGSSFTGNLELPNRSLTDYVWIETDSSVIANLSPNTRVDPVAHSSELVTLKTTGGNVPAVSTLTGANHYIFRGIKFDINASTTSHSLAVFGDGAETNAASQANHIILDHCVVKPPDSSSLTFGIIMHTEYMSMIGCWVGNIKRIGLESKAVWGENGAGKYSFWNTLISASSINVMFGGAAAAIVGQTPSHMEFRKCYFWKDPAWAGTGLGLKNLFEVKHARHVYIEGSVLENFVGEGQNLATNIKSSNDDGTAHWAVGEQIHFKNNKWKAITGWFGTANDFYNGTIVRKVNHVSITNALVENVLAGGGNNGGLSPNMVDDFVVSHVTVLQRAVAVNFPADSSKRFSLKDSIIGGSQGTFIDGFYSPSTQGTDAFNTGTNSTGTFTHNTMPRYGASFNCTSPPTCTNYPGSNNIYPADSAAVGFASGVTDNYNPVSQNFALSAASASHNTASDGTDRGVNYAVLTVAITGVDTGVIPDAPASTTPVGVRGRINIRGSSAIRP